MAKSNQKLQSTILTAISNLKNNGYKTINAREVKEECKKIDTEIPWNNRIPAICAAMRKIIKNGGKVIGKNVEHNEFTITFGEVGENVIINTPNLIERSQFKKKTTTLKDNINEKLELSRNFKVVMICAGSKVDNSSLIYNNQEINFYGQSRRNKNEFLPDDLIDANGVITWRDYIINNQNNNVIPKMAYELYKRNEYRNLYNFLGDSFYILSAGWGLVKADFRLPKYDITFSTNADNYKKRKINNPIPNFSDFNQLNYITAGEDIIYIGSESYLVLFYRLTKDMPNRKIVYFNSKIAPLVPNETFHRRRYLTNIRTNWHYELALEISKGNIP